MSLSLLFISGGEIAIVFVVILLLFGAKSIPELAKGLGNGMREFKKATDDIKKEFRESTEDITKDINQFKKDIESETKEVIDKVKKDINSD
ncbi:MAG: twin-arginine translocase TatA/TatE family subunit [Bacteroidales bacterium]|nr:twin-arginine translocase TatA/TatE family subunit [Bacteroidales bacterium]MCB9013553.1 twin-arginine translocase TatA/TatE family subunit [Bacteroidales bacterium]